LVDLAARLPALLPLSEQPRPIILDSSLRTPPTCKLLVNAQRGISHGVTIVHRALSPTNAEDEGARRRAADLERAGARLVPLELDGASTRFLSLLALPLALSD